MGRLSIVLLGMAVLAPMVIATDYCTLDCNGVANSACNCTPAGDHCTNPDEDQKDLENFRIWMVEIHNDLRNKLALGNDYRAGMDEGVANMHTIDYDLDLEEVARCYMNKCQSGHDKCRRTLKFKNVGQNLYRTSERLTRETAIRNAIKTWYEEIDLLTTEKINEFTTSFHPIQGTGHFTQVVWAKTTHIGCARYWDKNREESGNPDKLAMVIACNYGPSGNFNGESIFKKGTACSNCKNEPCNDMWKGLCGKVTLSGVVSSDLAASFSPRPLDVTDLRSIAFVLSALFLFWLY